MEIKISLSEQRNTLAEAGAIDMIIQNQPIQLDDGK